MVGFDEYERKARLTPGLLAALPVAVVVVTLGLKAYPAVAAIGGLITVAGGTYLLAILVRGRGRAAEPELWRSWGGPPTTSCLRTRAQPDNRTVQDGWRDAIQVVSGIALLSADEEAGDPDKADELIEASVQRVLGLGQDERYGLVAKENAQYGFERNFYAVRAYGRAIAAVCVIVLAIVLVVDPSHLGTSQLSTPAIASGLSLDIGLLLVWCFVPSSERTRLAGERYAKQLLQAVVAESQSVGALK